MSKLLKLLKEKPLTLIVHLPENSVEMAQAAEASGADALLVTHGEDEEEILKAVSIPVGLDVDKALPKQVEKKLELKFDFLNFHPDVLEHYGKLKKTKIVALDDTFTLDKLMNIGDKPIDGIDAAIIPINQEGRELIVGDLQNYIAIALSSDLPVIIPTQRSIRVSEVPIIWDTGVKGLILTKVVLGDDTKSLIKTVKEYRAAIDDIDTEN